MATKLQCIIANKHGKLVKLVKGKIYCLNCGKQFKP